MKNQGLEKSSKSELENRAEDLIKLINISLGTIAHHIERTANYLRAYSVQDGHMIDGVKLPEYQKVIDALKDYRNALIERINNIYKIE